MIHTRWTGIGGAFPHQEGLDFNIELKGFPLDGRLAVLPPDANTTADLNRPSRSNHFGALSGPFFTVLAACISNFVLCVKVKTLGQRVEAWKAALRRISKSGQQNQLEPLGLAGDELRGHAMACSL